MDTVLLSPVRGHCSHQSLTVTGSVWPLGVKQVGGNISVKIFFILCQNIFILMRFMMMGVVIRRPRD